LGGQGGTLGDKKFIKNSRKEGKKKNGIPRQRKTAIKLKILGEGNGSVSGAWGGQHGEYVRKKRKEPEQKKKGERGGGD